ncbi:unannotated protein [freshwater metagenome]|uniref:Unannotated protein n=1 Tax=freshwater metagenome TaxID=449393 RepID=A0A6J7KFY4_9ZZZZ
MRSASKTRAALAIEPFIAPAILASRTSRDSRLANCIISAVVTALPSKIPPLITSIGFSFEKSLNALAASIGSPLINATADGPASNAGSKSTPASLAASFVKVFLTTEYLFLVPSERRSCFIKPTESPRYSVSTVAFAVRKSSAISATAAVFSGVAIWHPF